MNLLEDMYIGHMLISYVQNEADTLLRYTMHRKTPTYITYSGKRITQIVSGLDCKTETKRDIFIGSQVTGLIFHSKKLSSRNYFKNFL